MIEVLVALVLIGILGLGVHLLERWLRRGDRMSPDYVRAIQRKQLADDARARWSEERP